MGLPGAGKSCLAARLLQATGWSLLDRDRLRQQCFPDGRCDRPATRATEQMLARQITEQVVAGRSLILDGMTLARRVDRLQWARQVQRAGGEWRVVFLDCTVKTAAERVEADRMAGRHPAGDRDAALVQAVAKRLERPERDEPVRVLGETEGAEAILDWLASSR